jgi:hypothetical protein
MTDGAHGVNFDLNADGPAEKLSWTAPGSDDAFLSLDLNQTARLTQGQNSLETIRLNPFRLPRAIFGRDPCLLRCRELDEVLPGHPFLFRYT